MRTSAQRNRRKTAYRVLNVVFILIGVVHLVLALVPRGPHDEAFTTKIEIAVLWLALAGMWVAISRIWGELAEENADSK